MIGSEPSCGRGIARFDEQAEDLDPAAQLVDTLDAITPEVEAMAGDAGSAVGTGGMRTKLRAGRITQAAS